MSRTLAILVIATPASWFGGGRSNVAVLARAEFCLTLSQSCTLLRLSQSLTVGGSDEGAFILLFLLLCPQSYIQTKYHRWTIDIL